MRLRLLVLALTLFLLPAPSAAQNREHLQLTADLQILQEQVARLQLTTNQLAEQLKATNTRVDQASETNVKSFANQQLLINTITGTLTTMREKLDDNAVRVSQLTQELSAIREGVRMLTDQINILVGALQPPINPDPNAAPGTPQTGAGGLGQLTLPPSPSRYYDDAESNFMAGRYDSALEGFREVVEKFPGTLAAANAQFYIGEIFYQQSKCREAIPEYQKVIANYKESDKLPDAYFMQGNCYQELNQTANATKMFQQLIKLYPQSPQATLATQRLRAMGVIK
jgi:tol-pal system protein YbgF